MTKITIITWGTRAREFGGRVHFRVREMNKTKKKGRRFLRRFHGQWWGWRTLCFSTQQEHTVAVVTGEVVTRANRWRRTWWTGWRRSTSDVATQCAGSRWRRRRRRRWPQTRLALVGDSGTANFNRAVTTGFYRDGCVAFSTNFGRPHFELW